MEIEDINVDEMFDFNPNQSSEIMSSSNNNNSSWEYSSCYYGAQNILKKTSSSSSSLSSSSSSAPKLLSFENSQVINFSSDINVDNNNINNNKVCKSSTGRTTLQARDHVVAEKKRRHNLNQLFISLSQVVPGLKKLDKASVLEDAIEHMKELEDRVRVLEEEISLTNNFINTYSTTNYDHSNNYEMMMRLAENNNAAAAEIKVRISDKHVLIKVNCKKQKGLMCRVPRQLEEMHLSVLDIRIMPFGTQSRLDITLLAHMRSEFSGTVKDIVDQLQRLFVNPPKEDQDN